MKALPLDQTSINPKPNQCHVLHVYAWSNLTEIIGGYDIPKFHLAKQDGIPALDLVSLAS